MWEEPHTMTWEEWEAWHDRMRAAHPYKYFLRCTLRVHCMRMWRRARDAYWWVLHRVIPRYRYHILRTGLEPGYYDPCIRILYAVMTEVTRFVEGTKDTVDWQWCECHAAAWAELQDIAAWWARYQVACAEDKDMDNETREKDADHQLQRVMRLRSYLWYP